MGTMSDWEVMGRLARKLEVPGFEYKQAAEVMDELGKAVPFFAGATHKALENKDAIFGKSKAAKTRAAAKAVKPGRGPRSEKPDKDYPFRLAAEFDEFAYKATALSSEVAGLRRIEPAGSVIMNPGDAEAMNVETGNPVSITSRRGKITLKAILSDGMQPGVAKAVARSGEFSAESLLDVLLDPASKALEELCAVRIEKL
jgi:predicted molibdopterin-dependent oxidoreductase YjgC